MVALSVAAFANISGIDSAFKDMTGSVSKMGGGVLYTIIGLLPWVLMLGLGIFATMYKINQKSDQDSGITIAIWGIGGAIAGAFAGIMLITAIGLFALQDATAGYTIFSEYMKQALAAGGLSKEIAATLKIK